MYASTSFRSGYVCPLFPIKYCLLASMLVIVNTILLFVHNYIVLIIIRHCLCNYAHFPYKCQMLYVIFMIVLVGVMLLSFVSFRLCFHYDSAIILIHVNIHPFLCSCYLALCISLLCKYLYHDVAFMLIVIY